MLAATATPLRSMARSTQAGSMGRAPACTAMPTTNRLAVTVEPNRSAVTAWASAQWWIGPLAEAMRSASSSGAGRAAEGSMIMAPVGVGEVEPTTAVRSDTVFMPWAPAAVSWSRASSRSAWPWPSRLVYDGWAFDSLTSLTTGPAFWDRPIWSRPRVWKPSSMAAVPMTWPTVTTPVPPTPVMRTDTSSAGTTSCGSGADGGWGAPAAEPSAGSSGSSMVMNDGQSPSRQLKSRLQVVWSMVVLRPKGVSVGWTDRQLLMRLQSPHPSQIRWLITTRCLGVSTSPRLRARRDSAAQAWSWISTVTPGTSASTRWASVSRSRSHTSTPPGSRDPA